MSGQQSHRQSTVFRAALTLLALLAVLAWSRPAGPSRAAAGGGDERRDETAQRKSSGEKNRAGQDGRADDDSRDGRRGGGRREWRGGPRNDREPPTEAEWQEARAAMQKLAPNAWANIRRRVPEDAPFRPEFVRGIVDRHRDLVRLKKRDKEQYEAEVAQLQLEDEILGIAQRLREGEPPEADALKRELREKVGQLVELRFKNREARIAWLAKVLDRERGKLEQDRANKDRIVEKKYDAILNGRRGNSGPFGNPGGDRGEGGPRHGGGGDDDRGEGRQKPAAEGAPTEPHPDREAPPGSPPAGDAADPKGDAGPDGD